MKTSDTRIMKHLEPIRAAYLRQPEWRPPEAWYATVMQRVRNEPVRPFIAFTVLERSAWRMAAAAAALAIVAGIADLMGRPRIEPDWQLAAAAPYYEWVLAIKE